MNIGVDGYSFCSAGSITRSRIVGKRTRKPALLNETSALTAVLCCGYGITTGQNWFTLSHPQSTASCLCRKRWSVFKEIPSPSGCAGQKGKRMSTDSTGLRALTVGTRNQETTSSENEKLI